MLSITDEPILMNINKLSILRNDNLIIFIKPWLILKIDNTINIIIIKIILSFMGCNTKC